MPCLNVSAELGFERKCFWSSFVKPSSYDLVAPSGATSAVDQSHCITCLCFFEKLCVSPARGVSVRFATESNRKYSAYGIWREELQIRTWPGLHVAMPNTVEDLLELDRGIICHCSGEKKCTQGFARNQLCCSSNHRWHNHSVPANSLFASIVAGKHIVLYSEGTKWASNAPRRDIKMHPP